MTPSELAAELRKELLARFGPDPSLMGRCDALLAALDRAAGPVEWTEADQSQLDYMRPGAPAGSRIDWAIQKLRAFVSARQAEAMDTERLDWLQANRVGPAPHENRLVCGMGSMGDIREYVDAARAYEAAQKGAGR